ncbi:hypothetical protein [Dactylosporangium matsuzakiense]|uniref:Uncharacterized protein n=1 Tax=Dactylosporangium matsuzakiense TaxID=53360 RepID=A0A9W6NLR4_9ACTN|nr:hypothetical protein [Dactylosporangium matsuzakiense]GLL02245.1 hypothetical protein GCM10017581_039870 [Dactylosporangium matsuzakiense]
MPAPAQGVTDPTPCSAANADSLLTKRPPGTYEIHTHVNNGISIAFDSGVFRYSESSSDQQPCLLNVDLNNNQWQPLFDGKVGRAEDSTGTCPSSLPTGALPVEREKQTKLCGFSKRDGVRFALTVTLSGGRWAIDGTLTVP